MVIGIFTWLELFTGDGFQGRRSATENVYPSLLRIENANVSKAYRRRGKKIA
jgi:hypothetical protein